MTPVLTSSFPGSGHIRKMEFFRDLDAVANLIEMCFPIHLDQDGQAYINDMRRTAQDLRLVGWVSKMAATGNREVPGFVWEEDDRIIGNLSLIPFNQVGRRIQMIANVSVHPDYRRQGIARALTEHALDYLRQANLKHVWLQVRDDNLAAIQLYRSAGFVEQGARTTWRIKPSDLHGAQDNRSSHFKVRRRILKDWPKQKQWLEVAYPLNIRWYFPGVFQKFNPGFLQWVTNFFDNVAIKHWALEEKGRCVGVITWQKTRRYANNLWLALAEESEETSLPFALGHACQHLIRHHPLAVDYPKGRFEEGFEKLGFEYYHTLVWMHCELV